MPKKAARPIDPQELARELVDQQLADITDTWFTFLGPESDPGLEGWTGLVESIRHQDSPEVTDERYRKLQDDVSGLPTRDPDQDPGEVLAASEHVYAQAGFLIGLELGRRLGGAR